MSAFPHHPASIDGIKRLAKSIKRKLRVTHLQALDIAAKRYDFESFQHAKNTFSSMYEVYVTSYWRIEDGREGRETMRCRLHRPLSDLTALGADTGSFNGFRVDAQDHLEERDDRRSQESSRESVLETIRRLQFADMTGLRPWSAESSAVFDWAYNVPGRDHASGWIDPSTEELVFADEPYSNRESLLPRRQEWAKNRGVLIAAPRWAGMYKPEASTLFLACKAESGPLLERVLQSLERASAALVKWTGDSASYHPTFVSPLRQSSGKPKKPRPRRLPNGTVRDGAILIGTLPGNRWWRPNARMPLDAHHRAAAEIRAAVGWNGYANSSRYRNQVRFIWNTLDLWLGKEHPSFGVESADQSEPWLREMYVPRAEGHLQQRPNLGLLRALLVEHYPDSPPLRQLLRRIDAATQYVEQDYEK